jgi:hypothetical protein
LSHASAELKRTIATAAPARLKENAKSSNKDFIVIEGSMTSIGACTNCARPATEYSNARKNFFDYAARWINERF